MELPFYGNQTNARTRACVFEDFLPFLILPLALGLI